MKHPTWLLFAGMAGNLLAAGEFAPPAEGPVAFRRDRIPLEADAMGELSRDLETLARGLNAETAGDRRGAAQMLALSLALDPGNAEARRLISRYKNGKHIPEAEAADITRARTLVWQFIGWLDTPEAGAEGHALAGCLKDVIIVSDPKHPQAAALRSGGEHGTWNGWIPELAAYRKKVPVKIDEPETPPPAMPEESALRLDHAELSTVLWQRTGRPGQKKWLLEPASLEMNARIVRRSEDSEQPPPFTIAISNQPGMDPLRRVAESIKTLLSARHGELPRGIRVQITGPDLLQAVMSGRSQAISAAAAVLAESAISGRVPDAMILGVVDESGAYKLPGRFWDLLHTLGKGQGQRLVLPAAAAELMPSMLALEKPEFFLGHEVLFAADFEQLIALATRNPDDPEPPASAKFREIRERAGNGDVRTYIGNSFVKQRLAAVLQDMPSHVSAKMLLTQASGNRPVYVCRAAAAAELRRAIAPIGPLADSNNNYMNNSSADIDPGKIYDSCRAAVDGLERYVEKNDRQLVAEARDVVIAVRTLDRASRVRGDSFGNNNAVFEARKSLSRLYSNQMRRLDEQAGDKPANDMGQPGGWME